MAEVSITKSRADILMAIISAIIAVLTFVLGQGTEITIPVILGAVGVFLTAILNFVKTADVPEPTPEPEPEV